MLRTVLFAGLLASGVALAENEPAPPATPPASAPRPGHSHDASEVDLESQLQEARERLQQAAREVANLSSQLNRPFLQRFTAFGDAIIGLQLDLAGGKDGAQVREVSPGGPAAEAGIRAGDVIVAVNGTEVKGEDAAREVVRSIRGVKPDSKLTLRVLRDGKTREFTVTARPGPGPMGFAGRFADMPPMTAMPAMPAMPAMFLGDGHLADMELATLSAQLGKYFGTDKGVLVVRAPSGGALKLEDGDVILTIDGREPKSGSHATRILASYQPGEKITLRIVRQRKPMDIETTMPEDGRRNMMFRGAARPDNLPGPGGKVVIIRQGDEAT